MQVPCIHIRPRAAYASGCVFCNSPTQLRLTCHMFAAMQVDDMCDFADVARQQHSAAAAAFITSSTSSNPSTLAGTAAGTVPEVPWLLGGYSLGGLTAAHAVLRHQGQWSGLVLVSAALGLHKHGLVTKYVQSGSLSSCTAIPISQASHACHVECPCL
jgi:alpha-beta hydrolase superfamily lysophospholipase